LRSEKKLEAGDDIDSHCLKCKQMTNHTIIALTDGKVAKVQCNVCRGRHNYRPAKPEAAKKTATPRTPGTPRKTVGALRFETAVGSRNPAAALPYATTATFKEDDLIDHPVFGLGLVLSTTQPNRIEVLFKEGVKVLVCVLAPARR